MSLHPFDAVGLTGVALILGAQALLQLGRLRATQAIYPAFNAVGAALILVSLIHDFNLSAAVIEGAWLIISLFGLTRNRRRPNRPRQSLD